MKTNVRHHQLLVILFRSLAPLQTGTRTHLQERVDEFFVRLVQETELMNEF